MTPERQDPPTDGSVAALARHFGMAPHPEGGHYRETHRSAGRIAASALPPVFGGERVYSTAILFLLGAGERSRWHRIRQDEVWHFHAGGALRLAVVAPDGEWREVRLGTDFAAGEQPQAVAPAGHWFAATPAAGSAYSLVGCTVAPGFEFADFELADPVRLAAAFPHLAERLAEFHPVRG